MAVHSGWKSFNAYHVSCFDVVWLRICSRVCHYALYWHSHEHVFRNYRHPRDVAFCGAMVSRGHMVFSRSKEQRHMISIIQKRNVSFMISGLLVLGSIVSLVLFGLKPGIDFTGGSLLEVRFTGQRPSPDKVETALADLSLGSVVVQPTNEDGYILRTRFINEEEHQQILARLRSSFETADAQDAENGSFLLEATGENGEPVLVEAESLSGEEGAVSQEGQDETAQTAPVERVLEERVETIGPSISQELISRSWKAGIGVLLLIVLFIAYSFRRVSKPVESWKYGVAAVIALAHDVLITMGVFALLGKWYGVEVDIPFIVALLTILGYSVNDTIVVFDRVRENLIKSGGSNFLDVVKRGVNQTILRSINTSFTTLLVLVAMYFFFF